MITIISIVTSVKDYVEVVHQLIDAELTPKGMINTYNEFGPLITYILLSLKTTFYNLISLNWLKYIYNLPIIIPDISSSLLSEISILDGDFNNIFNVSIFDQSFYGENNILISSLQKFSIGLINSLFLWLPTSTAHIITLRRFVMQGLEAGYMAGLGTLAGSILWITCIIFGCRFVVIPWLSLDIFRYCLGFLILVKYMWDSYNEKRMVLEDLSKQKIFLLNFLLALTEQTSIYPFITNLSIGPETSIIENFPSNSYVEFLSIHGWYVGGLIVGSLSLLNFTCWFIESYGFNIYMWFLGSFKVSTGFYYKLCNFIFLYLTMFCAISSIPYYGLDYTVSNPLGYVPQDRITDQKLVRETAFLDGKASDRNTRKNRGRHGRREKWTRRVRQFRAFDASLYDQGTYDLFTIEDLNYGFDKFWLRRKMRNHRVRFRFFPGDMMRSFKKELSKPRLESYSGPRLEFFRALFEQVYEPIFHDYRTPLKGKTGSTDTRKISPPKTVPTPRLTPSLGYPRGVITQNNKIPPTGSSIQGGAFFAPLKETFQTGVIDNVFISPPQGGEDIQSQSMLRKFIRKTDARIKGAEIKNKSNPSKAGVGLRSFFLGGANKNKVSRIKGKPFYFYGGTPLNKTDSKVYSKRWKEIFSKLNHDKIKINNRQLNGFFTNFYTNAFAQTFKKNSSESFFHLKRGDIAPVKSSNSGEILFIKKENSKENMSQKDQQILNYRSILLQSSFQPLTPGVLGVGPNSLGNKETNVFTNKMVSLPFNLNNRPERGGYGSKAPFNGPNLKRVPDYKFGNTFNSKVLLHPMKFYLQKQQAFERKLRYYTPTVFRNFSAGNNASYFRVMMKRYFYYYKPDLRWERTIKVSSLRKALRKTKRVPKKLNPTRFNKGSALNGKAGVQNKQSAPWEDHKWGSPIMKKDRAQKTSTTLSNLDSPMELPYAHRIQKPTHDYAVVGKRISRYRFQIYKDVLQHWYYSPMNRLLLKFDVDSFIKRQPKSHFLTKNEENLLHLRRFLLSEHYNTLRWYTSMEHYRAMKVKIGGTKSFATRTYNQQFQGTFKKIRHLFAITPSQVISTEISGMDSALVGQTKKNELGGSPAHKTKNSNTEPPILKFDQPLINESFNNGLSQFQTKLILHEELLTPGGQAISPPYTDDYNGQTSRNQFLGEDILSQTINSLGNRIQTLKSMKNQTMKDLLEQQDYSTASRLLLSRGSLTGPQDNPLNGLKAPLKSAHFNIEDVFMGGFAPYRNKHETLDGPGKSFLKEKFNFKFQQELYFNLLKSWKRKVNNQKSLRTYLEARREKLTRRKTKKQVYLKEHLSQFNLPLRALEKPKNPLNPRGVGKGIGKDALNYENITDGEQSPPYTDNKKITTGLQKAITEAIYNITSLQTFTSILPNLKNNSFLKKKFNSLLKEEQNLQNSINILSEVVPENNIYIKVKNYQQKISSSLKYKSLNFTIKKFKLKPNRKKKQNKSSKQKPLRNGLKFKYRPPAKKTISICGMQLSPILCPGPGTGRGTRIDYTTPPSAPPNDRDTFAFDRNSSNSDDALDPPQNKNKTNFLPEDLWAPDSSKKKVTSKKMTRRRNQTRRIRGVVKKSTLGDGNRSSQKTLFLEQLNNNDKDLSLDILNKTHSSSGNKIATKPTDLFSPKTVRKKRSIIRKQRFWKQRRSSQISKRHQYLKGRMKESTNQSLSNEPVKKIKLKYEFEAWWFNKLLPTLKATSLKEHMKSNELVDVNRDKIGQLKQNLWRLYQSSEKTPPYKERNNGDLVPKSPSSLSGHGLRLFTNGPPAVLTNSGGQAISPPYTEEIHENLNTLVDGLRALSIDPSKGGFAPLGTSEFLSDNSLNYKNLNEFGSSPFIGNSIDTRQGIGVGLPEKSSNVITELSKNKIGPTTIEPQTTLTGSIFLPFSRGIGSQSNLNSNFSSATRPLGVEDRFNEVVNTNPIPFYVGWDESLRQFIVTNRFLSRRESGYSFIKNSPPIFQSTSNISFQDVEDFTLAPLKGMNALTTLTWITPFTTYDPDQFFVLGLDGFAPLNWRKFKFRHTILKTWLYQTQTSRDIAQNSNTEAYWQSPQQVATIKGPTKADKNVNTSVNSIPILIKKKTKISKGDFSQLNKNLLYKIKEKNYPLKGGENSENKKLQNTKNKYRRLKKRYRRVKKYPRAPVSIPSGPLVNEVLPIHYISAFYKRSRLPRDRYLKRKFAFGAIPLAKTIDSVDLTIRKRVKPTRKYHTNGTSNKNSVILPRRLKFIMGVVHNSTTKNQPIRWRPFSQRTLALTKASLKNKKSIEEIIKEQLNASRLKNKKTRYFKEKQTAESLRVRRLKRRTLRQTIRTQITYSPKSGGVVWPGDYLQNELVEAPLLETPLKTDKFLNNNSTMGKSPSQSTSIETRKIAKKKTLKFINAWQIQPKRYLLEKHNMKVIKKKLEKAYRSHKLKEKIAYQPDSQGY